MPRPHLPHLHRERKRGRNIFYVRRGHGPRYRLLAEYGSDAFKTEYEDALAGRKPQRGQAVAGTLQWLWDAYRKTDAWQRLAPATRRQRENIMLHVIKGAGGEPFSAIKESHIVAGLDRRVDTPSAARNFLDTMRGLYQWAKARGHVRRDPTADVKPPRRRKGSGFAPWTREDVTRYQARWPLGTKERVWLDVLCGNAVRFHST